MARKKEPLAKSIDRFIAELNPQDILIMGAGFVAGTQGYTPLTMLIGTMAPNGIINVNSPFALINANQLQDTRLQAGAAAMNALTLGGQSPAAAIADSLFWMLTGGLRIGETVGDIDQAAQGNYTDEQLAAIKKNGSQAMALGCVGMIEAYAITRPNFLSGVGSIIQGIGSIVPG